MILRLWLMMTLTAAIVLPNPVRAEPKDDIAALTREWAEAFTAHDLDRIVGFYSKDATVWGTNALTLRTTPEEVRSFFRSTFRIPNVKISFDNQTIHVHGNAAVAAGHYTFTAGSGDNVESHIARYSFTFLKQDERWLIIDHHSSPMPVPRGSRRT
jgi:uncharacterized protein (TIGR02246 family)